MRPADWLVMALPPFSGAMEQPASNSAVNVNGIKMVFINLMARARCTLLETPQFKRAFAQRLAVAVEADSKLHCGFILLLDDLRQGRVMFLSQFLVIGNHRLQLAHEPVNHHDSANEQQAKRR